MCLQFGHCVCVCMRACVHASCYIPCLYVENRGEGELENKEYWADWHHVATRWLVPLSSSHFISIWENRRTQRARRTGNTIITSRHTSKNTGGYWRTGSTIRVIACYCIDSIIMAQCFYLKEHFMMDYVDRIYNGTETIFGQIKNICANLASIFTSYTLSRKTSKFK